MTSSQEGGRGARSMAQGLRWSQQRFNAKVHSTLTLAEGPRPTRPNAGTCVEGQIEYGYRHSRVGKKRACCTD